LSTLQVRDPDVVFSDSIQELGGSHGHAFSTVWIHFNPHFQNNLKSPSQS
jgi:hypothetical protein